ncbi:MBL fold metallo-hydrolase [Porphyromonas sp. COT-239 OH1446]|uniref:MBL fold metallo-hydrolase n=1 Tax=Porphyromonas sp. COT-239 OH1446 TaxID=1515613 RepID=UPI00190F8BC8|nr:MBL fold metallo-hydrolase [Porphyromonas sp. COT-239 OH1446]
MSLASGSSGNCYYLGQDDQGILIDAGIPIRSIAKALKAEGIPLDSTHIQGVIVTHEHADHVRTVGVLGGVYHIPIYATERVHHCIASSRFVSEDVGASRRIISAREAFSLAGFRIESFEVPHDSTENLGYHISSGDDFTFTLATDIGHVTPEIIDYASRARHLVVEANYDHEMLESGPYPPFLRERVASPLGHLCNSDTAELLCQAFHPEMRNIWLCHLSKDNNHPDLCWKTIEQRLFCEGIRVGKDVTLTALKRTSPSPMYLLEP